jgi:hypothetical protein
MAITLHRRHHELDASTPVDPVPVIVESTTPAGVWWRTYRHHLRLLRNGAIA